MQTLSLFFGILAVCQFSSAQNGYDYSRPEVALSGGSGGRPSTGGSFPVSSSFPATGTTASQSFQGAVAQNDPGFVNNRPSTGFSQGTSTGFTGSPAISGSGPAYVAPSAGGAQTSGIATGFPARPAIAQSGRPVVGGTNVGFTSGSTAPAGGRPGAFPTIGRPLGGQQNFGIPQTNGGDEGGDYSAIPGEPGRDYPIYSEIPTTSFDCNNQLWPGYYADVEAQCQVFHVCALNKTFDFLCPNGTIFSQENLVCVWWNQFECSNAPNLYGNNAGIYDYSQNGVPAQPNGIQADAFPGAQKPLTTGFGGRPSIGANRPGVANTVGFPAAQTPSGVGFPVSASSPQAQRPTGSAGTAFPSFPSTVIPQGPAASYPIRPAGAVGTVGYPSGQPGFATQSDQFAVTGQNPTRDYLPPRQG